MGNTFISELRIELNWEKFVDVYLQNTGILPKILRDRVSDHFNYVWAGLYFKLQHRQLAICVCIVTIFSFWSSTGFLPSSWPCSSFCYTVFWWVTLAWSAGLLDFSLCLQHPSTFLLRYFNCPFCDLNSVVITTV